MATIPASAIVTVNPQVLSAGGTGLTLNGMMLTNGTQVPIGVAQSFGNAADVAAYFGSSSAEALNAAIYFGGFDNSNIKPGNLFFAQYNQTAVSAYIRGAAVTGITLAEMGALSGSLTIVVDGYTHTTASCSLSGCTSYSNAASIINTALNTTQPTQAVVTGSIATTTLTVSAVSSGTLAVGQTISGTGITAGTKISALGTGTGGVGTYTVNTSQTASSTTVTAKATAVVVSYDSVSGAFVITSGITGAPSTVAFASGTLAPLIYLTSATGAVLSQGAALAVPAAFMTALVAIEQDWATFMTTFDPDGGSGNTVKYAFAVWNGLQNNRWLYVCSDTDSSPTTTNPATSSLGYLIEAAGISGTMLIYDPTGIYLNAFACGVTASIDFTQTNGRITYKFKSQSGIVPNVTNLTIANNLIANGYNFYGAYATAADSFRFFGPGLVSGIFVWADSYVNQIWLNNGLQLDLVTLLTQSRSVPYNPEGYALIEAACQASIKAGLNFGAFTPGVVLTALQIAEANAQAGFDISGALYATGYYFQVLPAVPSTRAARTSPPCNFWYCDPGAIQYIALASIELQ